MEICSQCSKVVGVLCFMGTGVCCELCRKKRDGDHNLAGTKKET